jgi:halocyanin-like protein
MQTERDDGRTTRRGVLRRAAAGLTLLGAGVAGGSGTVAAQSEPDYGGWFDDVDNYDGTVDETGTDEVTVRVGTEANGGNFGFGPPAIRVSPGTTVVWRWTGEGGGHNVVTEEGPASLDSGSPVVEAGTTYSHTFTEEETGITKYYCVPHLALGMKGAVVVGEAGGGGDGEGGAAGPSPGVALVFQAMSGLLAGLFALVVAVVAYAYGRYRRPEPPEAAEPEAVTESEAERGIVRKLEHDEFDPTGTASLIVVYFVILVLMWVFMYFVEFLGNGPTVIG